MNHSLFHNKETFEDGRSGAVWLTAIVAVGAFAIAQGYPTDALYGEENAVELVQDLGMTNVEVEEIKRFGVGYGICGPLDSVEYVVIADTPQGNTVDVSVCKGLFTEPSIYSGM